MRTIPVTVVGGYLGAGKTTLVNRWLAGATEPIWVLVNDFGAVNIDAALVKNSSGTTVELTNGCVCCSFGDDLVGAFDAVLAASPRPARVVVEASGVADPRISAAYSRLPGLVPGGIVTVVDGTRIGQLLAHRLVGRTVIRQVAAADVIAVSRRMPDRPAMEEVRRTNPSAEVLECRFVDPGRWDERHGAGMPVDVPPHEQVHAERLEHPEVSTVAGARAWLTGLGPSVARAKGIVLLDGSPHLIERIGDEARVTPVDAPPGAGVVVITVGQGPAGDSGAPRV